MKNVSFWLDAEYIPRPSLSEDIKTDVVVVGGGITGVSIAYHCAKKGFKTVLVEKETVASGSAGRNGGMVVDGLEINFYEAIEIFGPEKAKELWMNTVKAREHVTLLIKENNIECNFERSGSLFLGTTGEDIEILNKEIKARKDQNIDCRIIEKDEQFKKGPIIKTLYNSEDSMLNPVKFVRSLAGISEKYGAVIYENTPALEWTAGSVKTQNGKINADMVVLALESYNPYLIEKESKIICSQAIVTEPLPQETTDRLDWKYGGMFWTADLDYISGRRIGNRFFACKSININATEQEKKYNREWQINRLISLFPSLGNDNLLISHCWTGLMVHSFAYHPTITNRNGYYEIFGHSGNGLTNGILCGNLISEHFSGKPIPEIYTK